MLAYIDYAQTDHVTFKYAQTVTADHVTFKCVLAQPLVGHFLLDNNLSPWTLLYYKHINCWANRANSIMTTIAEFL